MKPAEPTEEVETKKEALETQGLLEGMRGLLPSASVVETPPIGQVRSDHEISDVALTRAQLLQSLLSRHVRAPAEKATQKRQRLVERIERAVLGVLLLVAVIGALLIPQAQLPSLVQFGEGQIPALSAEVERFQQVIESVDAGETVFVAWEYGFYGADEMNLIAGPILEQLVAREAELTVVSTRPEARALVGRLLDEGEYTWHAYRPGGAIGMAGLLPDERPALILLLTSEPNGLRRWIEQVNALAPRLYDDVPPILVGQGAMLETLSSPYADVDAQQIEASIKGVRGAAAYEQLTDSEAQASQQINALTIGHLLFTGALVLGGVIYGLAGLGSGRKRN